MSALLWPRLLSLGQERRPILLFKNEVAAPACGKRIEDTFISLASNRAGLATFSNEQPFHLGSLQGQAPQLGQAVFEMRPPSLSRAASVNDGYWNMARFYFSIKSD
jgi:hypothetical protein